VRLGSSTFVDAPPPCRHRTQNSCSELPGSCDEEDSEAELIFACAIADLRLGCLVECAVSGCRSAEKTLPLAIGNVLGTGALVIGVDAGVAATVHGDGAAKRLQADEVVLEEADDEREDEFVDLREGTCAAPRGQGGDVK
jgi:hypothetical protein